MSIELSHAWKDRGRARRSVLITFPRAGFWTFGVALMVVLALFGCAPIRPPVLKMQASMAPTGPGDATIAAVRPIRALVSTLIDPQAAILTAMNVTQTAASAAGASAEIIIRTDGGETLSVVQPNAANLAPGERVMILPGGDGRRLVPAPPRS